MSATETDYEEAKSRAIDALISWLTIGDELGRSQQMMMMEFMGGFQKRAQEQAA